MQSKPASDPLVGETLWKSAKNDQKSRSTWATHAPCLRPREGWGRPDKRLASGGHREICVFLLPNHMLARKIEAQNLLA
jgi:hypothetical protein